MLLARLAGALSLAPTMACAQDLVPRAYVVEPVGANVITLGSSYFAGPVSTDPSVPITDFNARFDVMSLSYGRALNFFGRSATLVGSLPYALGNFHGIANGVPQQARRSGLVDGKVRVSVNLRGGPAMHAREFAQWNEKWVIGTSLTVILPTGQYDPARLVNLGLNRWAFKPELGISRRWGHWALDVYAGAWFFSPNNAYFPGEKTRVQAPVGSSEIHVNYVAKPRLWASLDGNFWTGGRSRQDGTLNADYQRNSRLGSTISVPINQRQLLKFSYSRGAYISIGGNYQNVSTAWQYSWLSRER